MNTVEAVKAYTALGWALVPIPAGKKGPTGFGWNNPERAITTPEQAVSYWTANSVHNVGLLHSLSRTAALDIDHVENTRTIFEALGIDFDAILASAPRIVGRLDRGKVLFRVPDGLVLDTHKLAWPSKESPIRTETVFELRAGRVQDVLPPSVHPDTQRPYTWAGRDWREPLPEIPRQLLALWTEWPRFRAQLLDICPWRVRVEPRPKLQTRPAVEHRSAIEEFKRTSDMHELLVRYGYRPTRQGRYLSPNSTSGIAGVVLFDDGRAYTHHASDPFDSAHAFDAFDLFCQYEYGGDVVAAVRAIGRDRPEAPDVPYDPEAIEHGRAVWASWQNQPEPSERAPLDGIPPHLLDVPGVLGDVVTWYNQTAPRSQPQFAVQAALAFGAVVMGRRWVTNRRNMSSLYFVNVAKSAAGKEHVKTVLEALLEAAGLGRYIGPSGYTSASGVFSGLIDQPNHITIIDELGRVLASSQAAGNHHKQDAQTIIMEVFGRQTSTLRPQGYSKMGMTQKQAKEFDKVVSSPSLTIMSMTTPSTLYGNLSSSYVKDGFLGRFIIVESFIGRQVADEDAEWSPPPDRAIEWAADHAKASSGDIAVDTYDIPPSPVMVPFASACRPIIAACDADFLGLMDEHERHGLEAMFGRSKEIAMRLALIVARSKGEAEISPASLQWAIDYVTFYALRTVASLRRAMSDGPFEAACKAVLEAISASGLRGMARHEIARAVSQFRNLEPRKREEVTRALEQDQKIKEYRDETGGRPRVYWRAVVEDGE